MQGESDVVGDVIKKVHVELNLNHSVKEQRI